MQNEEKKLKIFYPELTSEIEIPFFKGGIKAGFPSPADDYQDERIDLNKRLVKNPSSTFFGIVDGDSMEDVNIHDADLVIIDRSLFPFSGRRILCCIDGEFTIKHINYDSKDSNVIWLTPANNKYKPIKVTADNKFEVWGVVTYTITPHIDKFR